MSQATSAHPPVELSADERAELLAALSAPLPSIPSRYLYDDHGSALFEQITDLPEYYQTRTERQILETEADRILEATNAVHLGELGSGKELVRGSDSSDSRIGATSLGGVPFTWSRI